ncbi:MAG TPA: hypothetical protein VGS80_22370, partial [Ktedonobacterales bacterium]|nr:hypothetical protein [Ktedonobacterales bacterium]
MPRVCTVCAHAERDAIDVALVAGTASYRHIAAQYGLAWARVKRHKDGHLPAALAHAEAARE